MAFNNDLTQIIRILITQKHVQVYRDKTIQQIFTFLTDLRTAGFKEDSAVQHDIAGVRVHGGFQVRRGKGIGKVLDHGGPDTDQFIDAQGLGIQQVFLLLQLDGCGFQVRFFGGKHDLQVGQGLLLVFQLDFQVVQVSLDDDQAGFLVIQFIFGQLQVNGLLIQYQLLGVQFFCFGFQHGEILIKAVGQDQDEDEQQGCHHVGIADPAGSGFRKRI